MSPLQAGLFDAVRLRPGERVLDTTVEERRIDRWSLPFDDASFDVVLCRHAVRLLPDRGRALSEISRVLAPGGRVGVSAWGRIERSPGFAALADALDRVAGVTIAASVRWLFVLSEPGDLRAMLSGAGFDRVQVRTVETMVRFASVGDLIDRYVPGSRGAVATMRLHQGDREKVASDLESELSPWLVDGGLTFPANVNVGVARR